MGSSTWAQERKRVAETKVMWALRRFKGNREKAANYLGMSLRQVKYIVSRLKKEGVDVPEGARPPNNGGKRAGPEQAHTQQRSHA